MNDITYMNAQEFIEKGYLHEVNRLVLHPLGLALQMEPQDDGQEFHAKVWDYRDDPEGIYFDESTLSSDKAERVADVMFARRQERLDRLRFVIQPVATSKPTLTTTYIDPAERRRQRANQG